MRADGKKGGEWDWRRVEDFWGEVDFEEWAERILRDMIEEGEKRGVGFFEMGILMVLFLVWEGGSGVGWMDGVVKERG